MNYFIVAVLIALIIGLIVNRTRSSYLFFMVLCIFFFIGKISTQDMIGSFVNPPLLTLIMLVYISFVLEKSSLLRGLNQKIFSSSSLKRTLLKMSLVVPFLSAFINNTAVVAIYLGAIDKLKRTLPVSKIYLPLSFLAVLGGTMTLIGTSTNLMIDGMVMDAGYESLKFFDFFYVGIILVVVGGIYIFMTANRILPESIQNVGESAKIFFVEAKVQKTSRLVGKSIKSNHLRNLDGLFLAELIREEKIMSPVNPNEIIHSGDILVFTGDVSDVKVLEKFHGLTIFEECHEKLLYNLKEVVISHDSSLIGQRIRDAEFRSKFDAAVVAVRRGNKKLSGKIGLIMIEPGDSMVLATGPEFLKRSQLRSHFYLINDLEAKTYLNKTKSVAVVLLFVAAICLSVFGVMDLFKSLLILMSICFIAKWIHLQEFKSGYVLDLFLLLGSATGLSKFMIQSGFAQNIVMNVQDVFNGNGVYVSFVGIYVLSFVLTQLMTNLAAASLVFPIAITLSQSLGVSYLPFVMAIVYGASASFMTPFAYQTNVMVYSVGGYKLKDYLKFGGPLALIYSAIVIALVPIFFKF